MRAVMYGGGNIGRGFIGALFSKSGYEVCFIDVVEKVVEQLNRDGAYPVRIVRTGGYDEEQIENVRAVSGRDPEAASEEIARADVMATAVGVNALKFIVDNIALGLKKRCARGAKPINIIICENLIDCNKVLEGMLRERLDEKENAWFDENVGLVEASIGRMVPVQTPEMQDGNPLRVCVEAYGFLPVDKDGFRGGIPAIRDMVPFAPFDYYIRRKLFLHNCGHAICAYLGMIRGDEYIYQAIGDPEVRLICQSAMTESAVALSKAYGVKIAPVVDHLFDLLTRFTNQALRDTCARVGGDTVRKLGGSDRLIGAAKLARDNGVTPAFICLGAAAALRKNLEENSLEQSRENAANKLAQLSGLAPDDNLTELILSLYGEVAAGKGIGELRRAADAARVAACGKIV